MNDIFTVIRPLIDLLGDNELTWNERESIGNAIRATMKHYESMINEQKYLFEEKPLAKRVSEIEQRCVTINKYESAIERLRELHKLYIKYPEKDDKNVINKYYKTGFFNALELSLSILENRDPKYKELPEEEKK